MSRAAVLFLLLVPALAAAAPVTLGGDASEAVIVVSGVATAGAVHASADRIEIDLASGAAASRTYFGSDVTVRKVEITAGDAPRLSVQIRHSRGTTEVLAAATTVVKRGDGIAVHIPRDKKVATVSPAVTAPPAVEPPAVIVEPAAVQVKTLPAPPAVAVTPPAVAVTPPVVALAAQVPVAESAAAPPPPRLTGGPSAAAPPLASITGNASSPSGARLLLVGALLCGCGAAAVYARRRRGAVKPTSGNHIEILASRQLGGKTRAVLLSVNDSQMLLAVSDHGAQLLGQWFSDEDGARVLDSEVVADAPMLAIGTDTEPQVPIGVRRPSAAVAGLLKLKRDGDARFAGDLNRVLRAGRR